MSKLCLVHHFFKKSNTSHISMKFKMIEKNVTP